MRLGQLLSEAFVVGKEPVTSPGQAWALGGELSSTAVLKSGAPAREGGCVNSGAQTSQQLGRPVASPRTCPPPWIWFCAEGWEVGDPGPTREAVLRGLPLTCWG